MSSVNDETCHQKQQDSSLTHIYYYIDDNSTAFRSTIFVPSDKVTFGDFKKVFDSKNEYKYFCKEYDSILGREVKVELTRNNQKLNKSENGVIQLVLLSVHKEDKRNDISNGTLPKVNKGFNNLNDSFNLRRRRSIQALSTVTDDTDFGIQRVSMMTDPSLIAYYSRKAGENFADIDNDEDDYNSSHCDDYNDDEKIISEKSSSGQPTDSDNGPHKKRKNRAYVPSTKSSESVTVSSHSNSLPRVDEIIIDMKDAPCLGIHVVDHDGGIFISKIKPDSASDLCGLLEVGDQILQINKISFENLNVQQAVTELQKVAKLKKAIKMHVAKRPRISDEKSEGGLSNILCETTMPIDVSHWVETAVEAEKPKPFKDLEMSNNNELEDDIGGITSDEERAAYIDRRNGIGACLVPALHNFRNNNPIESSLNNNQGLFGNIKKENDENDILLMNLTTDTDIVWILRKMVHPNSGLEIANRKWLKIPFPNSFIGNDLINWLLNNVNGFKNKKHAQNYANMLLSKGYIKHVLDGNVFDKKRYYFFDEPIISYRRQIEYQLQQKQLNGQKKPLPLTAATTEVTFLSSPTYPQNPANVNNYNKNQLKSAPMSCGALPGTSGCLNLTNQNTYLTGIKTTGKNYSQAIQSQPVLPLRGPPAARSPYYSSAVPPGQWPISPIYPAKNGPNRNCESPQTNDYASMIQGEINSNYASVSNIYKPLPPVPQNIQFFNSKQKSSSPPPNTPNSLSANSSAALLPVPKLFHRS